MDHPVRAGEYAEAGRVTAEAYASSYAGLPRWQGADRLLIDDQGFPPMITEIDVVDPEELGSAVPAWE